MTNKRKPSLNWLEIIQNNLKNTSRNLPRICPIQPTQPTLLAQTFNTRATWLEGVEVEEVEEGVEVAVDLDVDLSVNITLAQTTLTATTPFSSITYGQLPPHQGNPLFHLVHLHQISMATQTMISIHKMIKPSPGTGLNDN